MIHFTKRWLSHYYGPLVLACSLLAAALISA